jgi:2,5-diamino-6-(ribosylamino)-4(3H)-pyrimidinone 5'-phosphate reductase
LADNPLRLYPLPSGKISGERIYEDLEFPPAGRRDPSRPYVLINMVSSLDGRTTKEGKAARIGSETDRQVMRTLRSKADAVMIGANTLRAERLSLGLDEPAASQPAAIILTTTGKLPLGSHLIHNERQEVLVLVPEDFPEDAVRRLRRRGDVLRVPTTQCGAIDLGAALKVLKAEHDADPLLVEGGPTLNHALISRNLADELFLTLAPKLLGGSRNEALGILEGQPISPQEPRLATLLSVHVAGDELFLRYKMGP